jgi:ABC-type antimicrobial peptide transport system permease subunit
LSRVRAEVQAVDPAMPLFAIDTLAVQLEGALSRERLVATLSVVFAALALVLASIGLYGVMAFAVIQRTNELGLRMALGAARSAVVRLVMRDALMLVGTGVTIGLPLAWIAARLAGSRIEGLIYGVKPADPAAIAGATLLLVSLTAIAAYLPAARAARIDPMIALRKE